VSLLDLLLVLILGSSVVLGFMAGFARVGLGFMATVAGLLFGFWFYSVPAAWIHVYVHSPTLSNLLGFLVVFSAFLLLGSIAGVLLSRLFRWTGLTWLDRLLGAGFGLVRGGLITVAFVSVLLAFSARPLPAWMVNSRLLPYVVDASDLAASLAPNGLKQAFRDSLAEIRKLWDEQVQRSHKKREPDTGKPPLRRKDA
jgi:membrane protein required for colicin V production